MADRELRRWLLAIVPIALAVAVVPARRLQEAFVVGEPVPVAPFLAFGGLLLTALGCVAYVVTSIAVEYQLRQAHRDTPSALAAARARSRRRSRSTPHHDVVAAVAAGAREPSEVGEVLDLHTFVARERMTELVARGRLVVDEHGHHTVATEQPLATSVPRTGARAARWIDTDDK